MTLKDFVRRGQAAQTAVDALTDDGLTADDRVQLAAIMDATAPEELATRVYDYYNDGPRCTRTPRALLYFHMGLLSGAVLRLSASQPQRRKRRVR